MRVSSFAGGLVVNTAIVVVLATVHFDPVMVPRKTIKGILLAPAPPTEAPKPLPPPPPRKPLPSPPIIAKAVPLPKTELPSPPILAVEQAPPKLVIPTSPAPRVPPAVVTGSFEGPATGPSAPPLPATTVVATGAFSSSSAPSRAPKIASGETTQIGSFSSVHPAVTSRHATAIVENNAFATAQASADRRSPVAVTSSAGFAAAAQGTSAGRNPTQAVSSAGFEAVALTAGPKKQSRPATRSANFHSVEILSKPKPEYTEDARKRRIEGEVWLEVLFAADGKPHVQRVLRSLGHGLDENAITATRDIRFRPARDGAQPVDQVATIRVQFLLAE